MPQARTVAVLVGSLRKDSVNRKTAEALAALTPDLKFNFVEIGDLPFFDQDLESDPPAQWVRLRQEIAAADAVLFVTPEYNRGLPAVLKNAIDVASRPYGQSKWNSKPGAVISVTAGSQGAMLANHQLRSSLVFLNVPTLQQPEAYISGALSLFDDKGGLIKDSTTEFLRAYGQAFSAHIERHLAEAPSAKA
ncbi:NADPH-dependent FMN reductase [uncultured Phenylobacterium sp.]|uniref:NADPH-dependent FMN reductase n=1 Tax=uncultured Phenylobacterium sp. TaxID=349273 RepID=UPI0025FAE6DD|nr:NAD(P)H-dependent oxidoreductase [uncultured Phenylobacterium sp.]